MQAIIDSVNNTAGLNIKASLTSDGKIQLQNTVTIVSARTIAETLSVANSSHR